MRIWSLIGVVAVFLLLAWAQGASAQCSVRTAVPLDIKPTSCPNPLNLRGGGVLPIAILGGPDLDVRDIDPTTIRLWQYTTELASPIRSAYEDVAEPSPVFDSPCELFCVEWGPDGYEDVTFKFSKADIIAKLYPGFAGEELIFKVYGQFYDGTSFVGFDIVRILGGGGPSGAQASNAKPPKGKKK